MKRRTDKYIQPTILFLFCGFLITACSGLQRPPQVRNYPAPNYQVDTSAFQDAGCPVDDSGRNVCPPESPLGELGCDYIASPGAYLGALTPGYPLNLCWKLGRGGLFLTQDEYIYRDGCLLPQYARYVAKRDGEMIFIKSLADLQKTYAPITTPDEALSYALAATGMSAYFGFEAPRGFRYFVDRLEDSHSVATDQGYLVYLYDYHLCGCGPHTTEFVEILVGPDGSVQEKGRTPAFEDPEQDQLCVD